MTYVSSKTENGIFHYYLGEGQMTADPIAEGFFGCAGVARIPELQKKTQHHRTHGLSAPCEYDVRPCR